MTSDRAADARRNSHLRRLGRASIGYLGVADPIKSTTAEAISIAARLWHSQIVMLTGDNPVTGCRGRQELELDEVKAGVLPRTSTGAFRRCRSGGRMSPWRVTESTMPRRWPDPMWASRWGPAPTSRSSSPPRVVLVKGDLRRDCEGAHPERADDAQHAPENSFFAFVYNLLGVPVAAGILLSFRSAYC